jgi:septal ring factor EnvC (AmiA/AmiB activator)
VTLPPDTARFTDARGRLRAPVQGKISRTYSSKHTGLSVKTRPKAQIVAPYAGRVEFAGAFKNYDNVIILNVGEGYFILLTGLGEIYAKSGNMVARGEPVALMPFNTNSAPELYIEFRKKGTAINPTPWLGTAFASQG